MASRSRIYLVRHATSTSNDLGSYSEDLDEPLSARGESEARSVADAFRSAYLEKIICSPFKRVQQTAEPVARNKGIEPLIDWRFSELSLGPWAGLHTSEIQAQFAEEWRIWRERPEALRLAGREDLETLRARVATAFNELALENLSMAIFAHDAVIRVLVAHVLNVSNSIYRSIPIANASISLVISTPERHELHLLNSCSHLGDLR